MKPEPMFNIPEKAPLWLVGVLVIVELIVVLTGDSVRRLAYNWFLLVPFDTPGLPQIRQVISLIGHGLLHGGWGHLLMNSAMIVIFAVITMRGATAQSRQKGRKNRANSVFLFVFFSGVVWGGIAMWIWWSVTGAVNQSALGASGGASALFAAAAFAMGGQSRLIQYGLAWGLLNVLLVLAGPILGTNIAWAAHIGGYLAGAALAPFFIKSESAGFSIL